MSVDFTAARAYAAGLIESFEGFSATAYWDRYGKVWTIGTGLTRLNGRPARQGQTITQVENDAAVQFELAASEACVRRYVTTHLLTTMMVGALEDACFNLGAGCLMAKDGPTGILRNLNAGNLAGAWSQLLLWDHAGGAVLPGLQDRRAAERAVALGLVDSRDPAALTRYRAVLASCRLHGLPLPGAPSGTVSVAASGVPQPIYAAVQHAAPLTAMAASTTALRSMQPAPEDPADALDDQFNPGA